MLEETTFVYECARPGCGYRIWRSDKGELGTLRFDLKCPKCHNESFRCLGKGDLPQSFNEPLPVTTLDFNKLDRVGLGLD